MSGYQTFGVNFVAPRECFSCAAGDAVPALLRSPDQPPLTAWACPECRRAASAGDKYVIKRLVDKSKAEAVMGQWDLIQEMGGPNAELGRIKADTLGSANTPEQWRHVW